MHLDETLPTSFNRTKVDSTKLQMMVANESMSKSKITVNSRARLDDLIKQSKKLKNEYKTLNNKSEIKQAVTVKVLSNNRAALLNNKLTPKLSPSNMASMTTKRSEV
jgi:hypothetical protein